MQGSVSRAFTKFEGPEMPRDTERETQSRSGPQRGREMMIAHKGTAEAARKSSDSHFGGGRRTRSLSHSHGGLNAQ